MEHVNYYNCQLCNGYRLLIGSLINRIDFLIVMTAFLCLIAEAALFQHHHDCTDDYKKIYKYLELARALVLLRYMYIHH